MKGEQMDADPTPKTVACPVCKRRVRITKSLNLTRHGPCRGWIGCIGYRYRVAESEVEKVPIGSMLIYREYRGSESQQDLLTHGEPSGGWYMDFVDVGVKYDGHWYDLDGQTESAMAGRGQEPTTTERTDS